MNVGEGKQRTFDIHFDGKGAELLLGIQQVFFCSFSFVLKMRIKIGGACQNQEWPHDHTPSGV